LGFCDFWRFSSLKTISAILLAERLYKKKSAGRAKEQFAGAIQAYLL